MLCRLYTQPLQGQLLTQKKRLSRFSFQSCTIICNNIPQKVLWYVLHSSIGTLYSVCFYKILTKFWCNKLHSSSLKEIFIRVGGTSYEDFITNIITWLKKSCYNMVLMPHANRSADFQKQITRKATDTCLWFNLLLKRHICLLMAKSFHSLKIKNLLKCTLELPIRANNLLKKLRLFKRRLIKFWELNTGTDYAAKAMPSPARPCTIAWQIIQQIEGFGEQPFMQHLTKYRELQYIWQSLPEKDIHTWIIFLAFQMFNHCSFHDLWSYWLSGWAYFVVLYTSSLSAFSVRRNGQEVLNQVINV